METFVGDTVTLVVDTGLDLSGYDSVYIKFKRPNKTMGYWTAAVDGDDHSRIVYTTTENDLNMAGTWILQAHAEDANVSLHGKMTELEVFEPLAETSSIPTTIGPTTPEP